MSSSMAELLDTFVKNDQTLFLAARRQEDIMAPAVLTGRPLNKKR
ncbi:hypothetical protein SNOG_01586 [Parastagonospora nodorum SN15]|uniref:Uncharacterized protein n=1 Tax=Phaeosphaeria nodorum (strain SN15 / ATCC MYA-4574 / FGSC 10173) TaxID=321614 RepID=Q0V328_PHANO|nr:hypothetical protein SNOG_01586 [Parastagonospora nodorum SN15]EAT91235.1 hypothetical protein SNOG_01586 [Parastagonospora nodorum SN15]